MAPFLAPHPTCLQADPKHPFVHFPSMGIPVTSHTGAHIQRAVTELSPSQSTCHRGPEVTPRLREQAARCMRACGHSNAALTIKGQEETRRRITVKPEMDHAAKSVDPRPGLACGTGCEGWTVVTPDVTGRAPGSAVMEAPGP